MEYYNPIDHKSKYVALAVTVVVVGLSALLLRYVEYVVSPPPIETPPLEILFEEELVEEPQRRPRQQSAPTDQRRDIAPAHVEEARRESSNQTQGEAEVTQTVNPNALFRPITGNSSASVPVGNRLAPDGQEESHHGTGTGYNLQGTDQLDAGLQGRGLREGLPKPSKNFSSAGRVVVYVTVDSEGNVATADIDLNGTTTSDGTLRRLALEAARRAKFRPGTNTIGGTITYDFILQ